MSVISPDACGGAWSPILAAGPQSALSGILAGFVFTGIVVVLSTKPAANVSHVNKSKQRSYALQLFTAAFITLALDSYFSSITPANSPVIVLTRNLYCRAESWASERSCSSLGLAGCS
jgi:hypothetical protein